MDYHKVDSAFGDWTDIEKLADKYYLMFDYMINHISVHSEHYTMQERIAEKDYYVYDFALPMLLINALYYGQTQHLKNWLNICPRKQFTTLDTHDGIGVVDVKDLLPDEEIDRKNGDEWAKLNADFAKKTFEVIYSENGGEKILNY